MPSRAAHSDAAGGRAPQAPTRKNAPPPMKTACANAWRIWSPASSAPAMCAPRSRRKWMFNRRVTAELRRPTIPTARSSALRRRCNRHSQDKKGRYGGAAVSVASALPGHGGARPAGHRQRHKRLGQFAHRRNHQLRDFEEGDDRGPGCGPGEEPFGRRRGRRRLCRRRQRHALLHAALAPRT